MTTPRVKSPRSMPADSVRQTASSYWCGCARTSPSMPPGSADATGQQVPRRLEIALGRPDVDPIANSVPAVQAVPDHRREHLALERDGAARGDQVDHRPLEHVRPGVDAVGRCGPRGLLAEL